VIAMQLIEPQDSPNIPGLSIPDAFYWVLQEPAPLAGMRHPYRQNTPWQKLHEAGFQTLISLTECSDNPTPLTRGCQVELEDLVYGEPPLSPENEIKNIELAVEATLKHLNRGEGVVIHCVGGRGRTGTVLACVLRELGFPADKAIRFLDKLHKQRGKAGWPEAAWQAELVRNWPIVYQV